MASKHEKKRAKKVMDKVRKKLLYLHLYLDTVPQAHCLPATRDYIDDKVMDIDVVICDYLESI